MNYILVGLACYASGFVWGLLIFLEVNRRLVRRLTAKQGLVTATVDLERRREAYDSGRNIQVRIGAGEPLRVSNTMPVRPGSLTRRH